MGSLKLASQSSNNIDRPLGDQSLAALSSDEVNRNIVSAGNRFREQQQAIRMGNCEDVPTATTNLFDIATVKPAREKVPKPPGSQSTGIASSKGLNALDLKIGVSGEQFVRSLTSPILLQG